MTHDLSKLSMTHDLLFVELLKPPEKMMRLQLLLNTHGDDDGDDMSERAP